jgi:hypothetical protein
MSLLDLKNKMWTRFEVVLEFKNRVIGGIPNDKNLIEAWIGAKMPDKAADEKQKLVDATVAELPKLAEEKAEGMWTTFKTDEKGIYLEGRCVKAMYKESANIMRELLIQHESQTRADQAKAAAKAEEAKKAEKSEEDDDEEEEKKGGKKESRSAKAAKSRFTGIKAKLAERLFVEEDKVYLMRSDGSHITKPDGNEEKPIHIMTTQGPRTALKRFDYVNTPVIKFTLRHMNDGIVDLELIQVLLEHSAWNGLGADRSQGNGLFTVRSIDPVK